MTGRSIPHDSPIMRPLIAVALALIVATPGANVRAATEDILERSRATYAALRSYADTGTIVTEFQLAGAPAVVERHSFTTAYRGPRNFFFEFRKGANTSAGRLVIWCDGGDFQSWWSETRVHEVYSGGRGTTAFATAAFPTHDSAILIPPLLFPAAKMHGPATDLKNARAVGLEEVNGERWHKISAETAFHFGASRAVTLWIDSRTLLLRKILVERQDGGGTDRITTTIEPQANPTLDDKRFAFAPPAPQK